MFCHHDYIKTMCHLNEVGTYYTKLISSLINIKHLVLTQQVKLAKHMASSSPFASDAELSAGKTITLPPVQKCLSSKQDPPVVYNKASNTANHLPLLLLHRLAGIY